MRTLAISTLLLGTVLSPMVFAQDDNALHYNIVNVQAEASRQVSNEKCMPLCILKKVTSSLLNFQIRLTS